MEVSTIDYFLYDHDLKEKATAIEQLDAVSSNVSDHYPIKLSIQFSCELVTRSEDKSMPKTARVNWKKVDEDLYAALQKTATTKSLRQICRRDNAHQYMQDKQEILDAKGQDTALFFRLINKHRCKPGVNLNELHIGDSIFKSEEEILRLEKAFR